MWISRKDYQFLKENAEKAINNEQQILTIKENERRVFARAMKEYSRTLEELDTLKEQMANAKWLTTNDVEKLRELFIKRMTVDSEHHDRRRKDFNQAIFHYREDGSTYAVWNGMEWIWIWCCNALMML